MKRCALLLSLSALALSSAQIAVADEWGTNTKNTGAHPDGGIHGYCYSASVSEDLKSGIREAEWSALHNGTDTEVNYDSTCKYSGSGETDVVWFQTNLPYGKRGTTFCEDFDGSHCDQFYIDIDLAEINVGSYDEYDEAKTTCHELGHSVGLTHGSTYGGCMVSGEVPGTSVQYRRYSPHHVWHINNWF